MKVIYRISDNSYDKPKLPGCTKQFCLDNFLESFSKIDYVIADNCQDSTIKMLRDRKLNIIETKLGNAGSFLFSLNYVLDNIDCKQEETVYFVEDDYIHKKYENLLDDGLVFADYVTLYDHPDKYTSSYEYGEICKVRKYKNNYWRSSISTTMTFASKIKTLRQDRQIFHDFCHGKFHPNDHMIFQKLFHENKKQLYLVIPSAAFHADVRSNLLHDIENDIEPWVIEILECELKKQICKTNPSALEQIDNFENIQGFKKLLLLNQVKSSQIL